MADGLLVREYLSDVFQPHPFFCKQVVVDFQAVGAHDIKILFEHQVIYLAHRACRAVFKRQHTVAAFARFDGFKNTFKGGEVFNLRQLKQLLRRNLRVSTLNALAGYLCGGREELRSALFGFCKNFTRLRLRAEQLFLIRARQRHDGGIKHPAVVGKFLARQFGNGGQLVAFAGGVIHLLAVCTFILRNTCRNFCNWYHKPT